MNATLAGIEELDLFPTPEAREKAIAAHADAVRGWDLILGIVIMVVLGIAAMLAAKYVIVGGLARIIPWPIPSVAREIITFGFVGACMFMVVRYLHRVGARHRMRLALLDQGVPVCLKCGYMLRGLPADAPACPECGTETDVRARAILARPAKAVGRPAT